MFFFVWFRFRTNKNKSLSIRRRTVTVFFFFFFIPGVGNRNDAVDKIETIRLHDFRCTPNRHDCLVEKKKSNYVSIRGIIVIINETRSDWKPWWLHYLRYKLNDGGRVTGKRRAKNKRCVRTSTICFVTFAAVSLEYFTKLCNTTIMEIYFFFLTSELRR